ncbi:tetratricopeptide repeat protein [Catenovulum sp. SX2]|uniref:tetratricopeptide repeat protein n=1 Tax=Catenovulum sp. SX2 TaxID=3398614 RepID=UPI003F833958
MKYISALLLIIVCLAKGYANENAGHQAFAQQDYQSALTHYQSAYQQNPLASTLYNIAVCQFKLAQWHKAQTSFKQIKQQSGESDLINYNIAVTYKKLGNTERATELFENLVLFGENEQIVQLASRQLDQLEFAEFDQQLNEQTAQAEDSYPAWYLSAQLALGSDDNAVAISTERSSNKSDSLVEALVSAGYIGEQQTQEFWSINTLLLNSKYQNNSDYDFSVIGIVAIKHFTFAGINQADNNDYFYAAANYEALSIAGNSYLNNTRLTLGYYYPVNTQQVIKFESQYKKSSAANSGYHYLAGDAWQHRVSWQLGEYNNRLKVTLDYTIDDRNDLTTEDSFTSYSANRSAVKIDKNVQLNHWLLNFSAQYKASNYHDKHLYSDGSELLRKDNKLSLSQRTEYNLNNNWQLFLDVNWTDNNSNSSTYSYQQTLLMFGVSFDL